MNALGIYIHWPFCTRICPYCDFNVYRARNVDAGQWAQAYCRDLGKWAARLGQRAVTSVYFGGGTPSLAPPFVIAQLLEAVDRQFHLATDAEITMEANPEDVEAGYLDEIRRAGINRISLGVQSFEDDALGFLGRGHTGEMAQRALGLVGDVFANFSFDLIYARPGQSEAAWRRELETALAFAPPHLSLYQLTIEPETAFAKAVANGRWTPAPETISADLFEMTQETLAAGALPAYEISNHARAGNQSAHNLLYWTYKDYLGLGPGAHGRVEMDGARYATTTPLAPAAYLEASQCDESVPGALERLSAEDAMVERISMGLRIAEGIPLHADDIFHADPARSARLRALIEDGFLENEKDRLRVTSKGRPLLNRITYELLS